MPTFPENWTPDDEIKFLNWHQTWAKRTGTDPNPDDPRHFYDYRSAYRAGAVPQISTEDNRYHWDSRFKAQNHPNRFVRDENGNLFDTITGKYWQGGGI